MEFVAPDKFKYVDIEQLQQTEVQVDALKSLVKKIHPWSSLYYGLSLWIVWLNSVWTGFLSITMMVRKFRF